MQTREQNTPRQVTITWTETSDVKLKFLEIFEIFEARWQSDFTVVVKETDGNSIYFNTF